MYDKSNLENSVTLEYLPDCHKNQEICNKTVDNYPYALKLASNCYIIPKLCHKTVKTHPFYNTISS